MISQQLVMSQTGVDTMGQQSVPAAGGESFLFDGFARGEFPGKVCYREGAGTGAPTW